VQKNGIRTGYSAPLTSRELAIDVQRVFGREDVDKSFRPGFPGFEVVRA
jgi:hypothetical protein